MVHVATVVAIGISFACPILVDDRLQPRTSCGKRPHLAIHVRPTTSIWPAARAPDRSATRRERAFCGTMAEIAYDSRRDVARSVVLAEDNQVAERESLVAYQSGLQPCGRVFG